MLVTISFSFRNSAHQVGVGGIFDRVLTELVAKMREMKMDKTELGCLRSIILFNPGEIFFFFTVSLDLIRSKINTRFCKISFEFQH